MVSVLAWLVPGAGHLLLGRRAKGVVFLVSAIREHLPDSAQRLASIKEAYPEGQEELHKTAAGGSLFYSYTVEHDRLIAARPDAETEGWTRPG